MIEFNGYLTGAAEKGFVRKTRKIGLIGCGIVIPLSLPMIFFFSNVLLKDPAFAYAMLVALALVPIILLIPKGKKEHISMLPKRIYTDGEYIVCVADRYTDSKLIRDVKKVIDHGEYYELCFPFGKVSEKFICQKSLLAKGTIQAFEALFDGKISRKKTAFNNK